MYDTFTNTQGIVARAFRPCNLFSRGILLYHLLLFCPQIPFTYFLFGVCFVFTIQKTESSLSDCHENMMIVLAHCMCGEIDSILIVF